ncbi:MAG: PD-(D/E)XK nuclease family protein [Elusimicrobiaceae bacterium]|nr:PD-(D/E)XK nuclease family protein [Elusimicrobiaceae bacterium]
MTLNDPLELNYSKVRAYRQCPVLYEHIYVFRRRTPLTPASSLGISMHRALDAFYGSPGETGMEQLLECYDANWLGAGYSGPIEQLEYHHKGREMLRRFWQVERNSKVSVDSAERDFEFEHKQWKIRGTVDRVDLRPDGTWEIIDYKTGPEEITEAAVRDSLQLGIYAIGAQRAWNIEPAELSVWCLFAAKKISVPRDETRDEAVLGIFEETGSEILRGVYKPNHARCRDCSMRAACRQAARF